MDELGARGLGPLGYRLSQVGDDNDQSHRDRGLAGRSIRTGPVLAASPQVRQRIWDPDDDARRGPTASIGSRWGYPHMRVRAVPLGYRVSRALSEPRSGAGPGPRIEKAARA
jgi:hypothetical protein